MPTAPHSAHNSATILFLMGLFFTDPGRILAQVTPAATPASRSAAGREPASVAGPDRMREPADTSAAGAKRVTALDIFFACRAPEAFTPDTRLSAFCSLQLPAGLTGVEETAKAWTSATPPAASELVSLREKVVRRQAERRAAAASVHGVRSSDLAGGQIVFGTGKQTGAMQDLLRSVVLSRLTTLRDGLRIDRAQVVAYARSRSEAAEAGARAEEVRAVLDPLVGKLAIDTTVVVSADSADWNRVSLYVQLPKIPASEIAGLSAVRFTAKSSDLDEGGRILAGQAADQVLARSDYRYGAVVEVTGYPDTANEKDLAARRAAALKAALVEEGVAEAQIVAVVSPRPLPQGAGTDGRASAQSDPFTIAAIQPSAGRLAQPAAVVSSGTGFGLGWEAVAQAATNAIAARAERELQQYMMTTFVRRLCDKGQDALRETCLALRDETGDRYLPSIETIRSLLKQDAERLPEHAVSHLLANELKADDARPWTPDSVKLAQFTAAGGTGFDTAPAAPACPDGAGADCARLRDELSSARETQAKRPYAAGAVMALYAFDFAKRVHRGDDPLAVITEFDEWLNGYVAREPAVAYVQKLRPLQSMGRFAAFAGAAREAAEHLRSVSTGPIPRDTLLRYAALQLVANAPPATRTAFTGQIAKLVEARRAVEGMLPVVDSIRRQIAALGTYGETARAERGELYARALDELVQIGVAGFMASASPQERERMQDLRSTVSSLTFAIRTRAYPQVLEQSLVLVRSLTPPPMPCEGDDCPKTAVMESIRFLTLAVDVSQATTQDELRGAMSRFVDEGGGVAAKRSGRPRAGLHLNSYVGLGGGWREGGDLGMLLRLPIGVEVVSRQTSRRNPSWVLSAYAQVVDLGGFLPQQGDAEDRSGDQKLAAVLSPGLFGLLSLGSSPVSLGLGVTSDTRVDDDRWRVRPRAVLFLGVDVPLLRIR
jgi:outer membrane protein OmpA-like peptidoglycan-associated protein